MSTISREMLHQFNMKGNLGIEELPPTLEPSERYLINGSSGQQYFLIARKDLISIRQANDPGVHLESKINERGYVEWRLYTRKWLGIKPTHDLYASLFYDAAMEYLFLRGNNTDVISETWNSGTINHGQYRTAMKDKPNVDRAIGSTFSWGKAQEHGFSRYEALSGTGLDVVTYMFLFLR